MILHIEDLSKSFGAAEVLCHISATIEEGARIGLIGVNGAGKSTMLNIITGALAPDEGSVMVSGGKKIGYLRQNTPLSSGKSVWTEMQSVFAETLALEQEILQAQTALSEQSEGSDDYRRTQDRLQSLTRRFEAADGYQIDVKIATVLTGLGFGKEVWEQVVDGLSGGERVRLSLGKLLLQAPDLLLLDEPTNHLDFKTLSFLEDYIKGYKGAVLAVSHDRFFLDHTMREIWEIEQGALVCYPGNYTKYKTLREERQARLQKKYEKNLQKRAALQEYIDKNLVRASTSAMAKSRRNQLERMEQPVPPGAVYRGMNFSFHAEKKSGFDVLSVENLRADIGGRTLFFAVNFEMKRGDKIALVGPNGIGKTTFLSCLLQPEKRTAGAVRWGKNVSVGYFDQHGAALDLEKTALDQAKVVAPTDTDAAMRDRLARVMLRGDAVFEKVGSLSGGQKAGLRFAMLERQADNVLLLDEPTNHLDLVSRENLEAALGAYDGTLLMISHDRYLLANVPDAVYALEEDGLHRYDSLADYLAVGQTVTKKPAAPKKAAPKKERARIAALRNQISAIEKQSAALEAENVALEASLNGSDYQALTAACEKLEQNKKELARLSEQWLELSEQLEQ